MKKRNWLLVCFLVAALDQVSKHLFENAHFIWIPNVVALRGVRNTGAAFSFLSHQPFIVAALSFALLSGLFYAAFRFLKDKPLALSLAVAAGGALGNLIDRALRGYVVDFIETLFVDFPVFNVADIAVTLGAALAAILILFRKEEKA